MTPRELFRKAFNLLKWIFIPGSYEDLDPNSISASRKRKTRFVILGAAALLVLMTLAALYWRDTSVDAPIANDIAVALALNVSVILLMVMAVLVFRRLIKLYFDRRGGVAGSRFQTKLVVAFLAMTLIPSALMYTVASELINDTVDKWINSRIERTLQESLNVAEGLYRASQEETGSFASTLSSLTHTRQLLDIGARGSLRWLLRQKVREYGVDIIQVYGPGFSLAAEATRPNQEVELPPFDLASHGDSLAKVAAGESVSVVDDLGEPTYVIAIAPIPPRPLGEQAKGAVVVIKVLSKRLIDKVHGIVSAFQDYKQLSLRKEIIRASYKVTLGVVTLVVVFSAVWFGFYVAKGITVPLQKLSEAAMAVSRGDLDTRVDIPIKGDEVGQLVRAFNRMTEDLKSFKEQVERSNRELSESNLELYHWGQYIEAVLENVGGVISIDKTGAVTTINDAAARMFGIDQEKARGRSYRKLFAPSSLEPIRQAIRDMSEKGARAIEREIPIVLQGKKRTLKTNVSVLYDHDGQYMGMVFVFDDVTDMIAAQRAIAWREMARQIAHEIKNPLTPIQLNAQRIRRKFEQGAGDFPRVLDDATQVIIQEVDQLKSLVDKFKQFATLAEPGLSDSRPDAQGLLKTNPEPAMLHDIIFDVVKLYRDTRPGVKLATELDPKVQLVTLDTERFRRVIINLVENAIAALNGGGVVTIRTRLRPEDRTVVVEVQDTGAGVDPAIADKVFQPYFSTKQEGTGLGLAIVREIVEEHGGRISLRPNAPSGAVFRIELAAD